MKRFILILGLIFCASFSRAGAPSVWRSSFTATADTTKNVCGIDSGLLANRRGFLHGVCVTSATVAASTFIVYNSSASAVNPIASIDATAKGCYYFDVVASTVAKGLTYSNSGTANVVMTYDCY